MGSGSFITGPFIEGLRDYRLLLDKGYPERGSLALVGDRYRLSKMERGILFRGVSSFEKDGTRSAKLVQACDVKELCIDGYNVLFTVMNYRLGNPLFISTDGFLRDVGGLHGRIKNGSLFACTLESLFEFLKTLAPARVFVWLDSPVSNSVLHAQAIREKMVDKGLNGFCSIAKSADYALKTSGFPCIATSDSALIDAVQGAVIFDLSRAVLEYEYGAEFTDLRPYMADG